MPLNTIYVGPFSGIFVGSYGSTDVLSRLLTTGTGGFALTDGIPEQYEAVLDNSIQSGLRHRYS